MILERIDTSINMSDHMIKGLQTILFHRQANFLLGHIPPMYSLMLGLYNILDRYSRYLRTSTYVRK
jgi:hypothetical protein